MDRMDGTPLGTAEPVLARWDPARRRAVAVRLLETLFDQVLLHGLFHVDLHPGNVLVRTDGTLALLDFGSVGRLDATTRTTVARLLHALARADSATARDALLELLTRPEEVDERALEQALGALIVR
jgi:ubiquinone biosynthesis protein